MRNRPYLFTKHCIEKNRPAKFIGEEQIRQMNGNEFYFRSLQNNSQDYKVMISNDKEFPACGCEVWKKNCYHADMFAVLEKFNLSSSSFPQNTAKYHISY